MEKSSSRQQKDRGGGGLEMMASKTQKTRGGGTPTVKTSCRRPSPFFRGKENAGDLSGAKAAAAAGLRWSTSSLPRGKAADHPRSISGIVTSERRCSVSGFQSGRKIEISKEHVGLTTSMDAKGLEDRKVKRNCKVPVETSGRKSEKGCSLIGVPEEKKPVSNGGNWVRVSRSHLKDETRSLAPIFVTGNGGQVVKIRGAEDKLDLVPASESSKEEEALGGPYAVVMERKVADPVVLVGLPENGRNSHAKDEEEDSDEVPTFVVRVIDNGGEAKGKDLDSGIQVFDNLNDKKLCKENSARPVDKYPSKLHEKLALLEGKVQRIAMDIKRTKEMLVMSDPDESKATLTEIQSKISGLEKAVDQVIDGSGGELFSSESVQSKCKSSAASKLLNHEELEARFFPHHRLLKDRSSLILRSSDDASKSTSVLSIRNGHGMMNLIDETSIAQEFLSTLDVGQLETHKEDLKMQAGGEDTASSAVHFDADKARCEHKEDLLLLSNENIEDFEEDSNTKDEMALEGGIKDIPVDQLIGIGQKISTGGWFVSEGEAVLLVHDDSSCSYYDIVNSEEKSIYKPPAGVPNGIWGDCWLIRAPGVDGCSGKYVVAASAGNAMGSGFCSWDFYTKSIQAYKIEDEAVNCLSNSSSFRTALAPISNRAVQRRSIPCRMPYLESCQWWYKPCGPLLVSTASKHKSVYAYDIRDGELVMKWEVNSPVLGMEYTSPIQWRSRGKVIIADAEAINLWDVNSPSPQPLLSVSSAGKKVYSLHVNNTDAELGGGVRQRVSSSEEEGNDGVFCAQDSVNVLDFRLPSGIGLRIPRHGAAGRALFARGDSIFVGSTETQRPAVRAALPSTAFVQQFSLRKGSMAAVYAVSESSSRLPHSSITQVWGNSALVMGASGSGLAVFDAFKDEAKFPAQAMRPARETLDSDRGLVSPTFDYLGARVLVISRDRPAAWKYLS